MPTPKWSARNLEEHHEKRLKNDGRCWQEILGISGPMTRFEYENESYIAYEKASIEYAAYDLSGRHRSGVYRVDKRSILTVASRNKKVMATCLHEHYFLGHKSGSTVPSIENLYEYIDELDAKVDSGLLELYAIGPVQGNLSKSQATKSPLGQRLKILRGKCVVED